MRRARASLPVRLAPTAAGLAIALPQVRRFRRQHSRIRLAPTREIDAHGLPALVVRYEDALGPAGVDVVFARDTLRVLDVNDAA